MESSISIVAASDNHYALLLAALIKSVEVNHKTNEKLDFYIIDDGISKRNKTRIQSSINPDTTTLHWNPSKGVVPENVKIPVDHTAFPLTTYLRLFGPHIVPASVKKIIYLDVDMIVQDDISKLYNVDIGDALIAAVQDIGKTVSCDWGGVPNWKELGMDEQAKYFNAGLLVINTEAWRSKGTTTKVLQAMYDNMKHVNFADQYGLNVALYNEWVELDPKWNWFANDACENPYIVHFLDIKPIFKNYRSQESFKTEFYKYLNQTAWKGHKPVSGYKRLMRKAANKIKKRILKIFS
ncbi:glycosyltransferase family 8 protein [Desertivirga brevis]|uniref:glycosyltransferase family 8 protein n=1 Tax=Desertivirga brevis TaxID=2810310 RepID=UPI001A96A85B|nr:glycosyltransferase family 8 protein [Pedobacter sp. SYSU D00873]